MLAGFGGSNIGVAQAYIADITEKEERSKGMGMIGAAFGLGFVFGPLIGGLISGYGYAVAGFGSAGFSFVAFLFALVYLKESNIKREAKEKIKIKFLDFGFVKETLRRPVVGNLIILFFIIIFSIANIYGTFSLLGYKLYNFSDAQNGYLFGIIGMVGAIIQGGFIRVLSKKFSERGLILSGMFFMMIGLGLIPYGINFFGVALIISVLAVGTGILQPTVLSMVSKYSPDNQQGAILGVNQSFSAFARVLGPLWGGFSFHYLGFEFPFLTGALFTFLTLLVAIIFLSTKKLKEAAV